MAGRHARPESGSETSDPVHDLLDDLARLFFKTANQGGGRTEGLTAAYHHLRAVAHDRGLHLTNCVGGKRRA